MKHHLIFLLIFMAIIYCSCDILDDIANKHRDSFVVIGDQNAKITRIEDEISQSYFKDSVLFLIDLDLDGVEDFRLYKHHYLTPCLFVSKFGIDCLHDLAKVYTNDTIETPEILILGDTLDIDKYWLSKNLLLVDAVGVCKVGGGDGIIHKYGNWVNRKNKYIGLLIEKEINPIYGWIKISISNNNMTNSLTIHQIGYKKAAYNTQ
ncbi:MAG: hypothetical protein ACERKD_19775 [Prolixibacteraceae bacterium]